MTIGTGRTRREQQETMQFKKAYEEQMTCLLGRAGFFAYCREMERPARRGLRLNLPFFPSGPPSGVSAYLSEPVPWARGGFFVPEGPRPGLSPLHEAGAFYLQEPSAMAPVSALSPCPGERVLDLCAAPGGKSTQIAALMAGEGFLVCNEPVYKRAQILSRNVERMGVRNAAVTCARPDQLEARFPEYFDRILVDAPCSGEGMFRREPEALAQWDSETPARCAARQARILDSAAPMLRPGGTLVYSTCTFNRTENEETVLAFLSRHPDFYAAPFALPGLPAAPEGMLHLFPHEIPGEGHFVCLLRRAGEAPGRPAPAARAPGASSLPGLFAPGCEPGGLLESGGALILPPRGADPALFSGVAVLRFGLRAAEIRGRHLSPDHALAMALAPREAARSAELTAEQALRYQAGETLELGDLPPGYTLLCLQGKSLGWGKQAGGIMKNHYPKGLRRAAD